jgi:hypothetical protein
MTLISEGRKTSATAARRRSKLTDSFAHKGDRTIETDDGAVMR